MEGNPTVWVAVRLDIPLHQQLVQACHAAFNSGKHYGKHVDDDWPYLIVVGVENEADLRELADKIKAKVDIAEWFEPDEFGDGEDNTFTSFATTPMNRNKGSKLFWHCRLWSPEV